nr:winged helix-turn-helix domain-containing protein [Peptoniphilus indolicus]
MVTAKEIEKAYVKLVGHSIGTGQIYRVLKRHGFRKIMPRSKYPKKASKEVIETSKKLTAEQKNLETLTRIKK